MQPDHPSPGIDLRYEPQLIAVQDSTRCITITWGDEHVSRYPFWYLRGFCPCAVCQGHGGNTAFRGSNDDTVGPDLNTIDDVGHYAINMTWSDGHKTGIYTLDALRNMCPCPACLKSPVGLHLIKCLPESLRASLTQSS